MKKHENHAQSHEKIPPIVIRNRLTKTYSSYFYYIGKNPLKRQNSFASRSA